MTSPGRGGAEPFWAARPYASSAGDAWAALELIERDLQRRTEPNFWRPEHLHRLAQLFVFRRALPRWVTSRWILAQAAQHLDHRTRGRAARAMEIAIETRGVDTLIGVNDLDVRAKVLDHDWVQRQVWLYELGALEHFVTRVASPDLLAGADRIHDWMRTPMGAFRLLGETPQTLTLLDLVMGHEVTALNIGSATLLEERDCAIGRLVPIEGGSMFESAPLHVPDHVALQVAEEPVDWVAAVAAGCRASGETGSPGPVTTVFEFGTLTDVPHCLRFDLAVEVARRLGEDLMTEVLTPRDVTPGLLTAAGVAFVRAALDERMPETHWEEKQWPIIAATLLDPGVFVDLATGLAPSDGAGLLRLADRLAGPAGSWCHQLALELDAAA